MALLDRRESAAVPNFTIGLALIAACSCGTGIAEARTAPALACSVTVSSVRGGSLTVQTGLLEAFGRDVASTMNTPVGQTLFVDSLRGPLVVWKPPTPATSVQLVISYRGSSLSHLGATTGGHIMFSVASSATSRDINVSVTSNRRIWNLTDIEVGSDDEKVKKATASFGREGAASGLSQAIDERDSLVIDVASEGKRVEATVDLSDTSSRDELLSRARSQIEAADPDICQPPPSFLPH